MFKKIILASLSIFLLSACSCSQYQKDLKTKIKQETTYKLISFGMLRMAVPKNATITFKDGIYSGNAGCNGMGGKYEVEGDTIKFNSGMSTLMACPDMSLETKFRKSLESVDNYVVQNGILTLNKDKQALLSFKEVTK